MSFTKIRKYALINEKVIMCEIIVKRHFDEEKGTMSIKWFKDKHWQEFCLLVMPSVCQFLEEQDKVKKMMLPGIFQVVSGGSVKVGYSFQPILSYVSSCLNPTHSFGHVEDAYCYKLYDFCNIKLVASVSSIGTDINELAKDVGFSSSKPLGINSYFPRISNAQLPVQDVAHSHPSEENLNPEEYAITNFSGTQKIIANSAPKSKSEDFGFTDNVQKSRSMPLTVSKSMLICASDICTTENGTDYEKPVVKSMAANSNSYSLTYDENCGENSELVSIREFIKSTSKPSEVNQDNLEDSASNSDGFLLHMPSEKSSESDSSASDADTRLFTKPSRQRVYKKRRVKLDTCSKPIDEGTENSELAAVPERLKLSSKLHKHAIAPIANTRGANHCQSSKRVRKTIKKRLKQNNCKRKVTVNEVSGKASDNTATDSQGYSSDSCRNTVGRESKCESEDSCNSNQERKKRKKSSKTKLVVSDYFPVVALQPLRKKRKGISSSLSVCHQATDSSGTCSEKLLESPTSVLTREDSRPGRDIDTNDTKKFNMCGSKLIAEQSCSEASSLLRPNPLITNELAKITTDKVNKKPIGSKRKIRQRPVLSNGELSNANSDLEEFQCSKKNKVNKLKRKRTNIPSGFVIDKKRYQESDISDTDTVQTSSLARIHAHCTQTSTSLKLYKKSSVSKPSCVEEYSSDDSLPESGILCAKASKPLSDKSECAVQIDDRKSDDLKPMEVDYVKPKADGFHNKHTKWVYSDVDEKTSWKLYEEIRNVKEIKQLNEAHLRYLMKLNEEYIKDIFRGRQFCRRHEEYKKGGKARRGLNHQINLMLFPDEQLDVILSVLNAIFCKRDKGYAEYVLKVLLPETLIKIVMDVRGTTHEETEEFMDRAIYDSTERN